MNFIIYTPYVHTTHFATTVLTHSHAHVPTHPQTPTQIQTATKFVSFCSNLHTYTRPVQEEIRFSINPECLVSMLICEPMLDNEAILIRGAEQFAEYSGYGAAFKFTGPHTDKKPIDGRNMRCVGIVAIDAVPQGYVDEDEYDAATMARELDKAYCGFSFVIAGDDRGSGEMRPVATGNWGCGAFGGDKELKTLQQWMAATKANRPIKYYSFKDKGFSAQQAKIVYLLRERKLTVGQLYQILVSYSQLSERSGLFNFVAGKLAAS